MIYKIDKLAEKSERLLLDILNIDSFTGNESVLADYLSNILTNYGFEVIELQHGTGRKSLIAKYGTPKIAFCSHLDTALHNIKPLIKENKIFGIGACDTKASIATQIVFAEELSENNIDIMLLFLAGEESDSVGAQEVISKTLLNVEYIIHGEPTNGNLGEATAGVTEFELVIKGEGGHSSIIKFENSSIYNLFYNLKLVSEICKKREWRFHIGSIHAGSTPGDFPLSSVSKFQIRSFCSSEDVINSINTIINKDASINILYKSEPCFYHLFDGIKSKRFWFGSDASLFNGKCSQILLGPGSIERAHSTNEFIYVEEIKEGIKLMVNVFESLTGYTAN